MSPMLDVQKRHAEIFRLRLGDKDERGFPKKLTDAIRVTSPSQAVVSAFSEVYGGEVTAWEQQWQCYMPITEIPVMVLPGDSISQWWETWRGSVCERRCDGETEQLSGAPCMCPSDITTRMQTKGVCRPMTRLNVVCPEVAVVGAGALVTHGLIAAETLPQAVNVVKAALERGLMVPATLRVQVVKGRNHFVVPQLKVVGVSLATLETGESSSGSISTPDAKALGPGTVHSGGAPSPPAASEPPRGPDPRTPAPPPALPVEMPSADERKALRRAIEGLNDDERKMAYARAKAAGLPNIDGPHFTTAHRAQMELLIRQARVLVACQSVGVHSDEARHELVSSATNGATSSSAELSEDQTAAVLGYCARLAALEEEGA